MSRFNLDAFNIVAGETSFFVLDANGKCIKTIGYSCPYAPFEKTPHNKKSLPIDSDDPIDLTETPTVPVYEKCPFCGYLTKDIREDRDPDGHFCFHCHCTSCQSEWAWSPKQSNGESLDGWSDS